MAIVKIALIALIALFVIGGLIFICFRKRLKIDILIGIAFVAIVGIAGTLVFNGGIRSANPAKVVRQNAEKVYVQWDPVSEEYLKFTFGDGQWINYIFDHGSTSSSYTTDGNDIIFSGNIRWEYDAYEDCYWQTYEKDGQIYKSKIFSVENEDWEDNHLFYQYRTDNGTACVDSIVPSGNYAVEISQASTAIAQKDYESAYRILSAIAEHSPEAKDLLSKFAFVPLNITATYMDIPETQTFTYNASGYLTSRLRTTPAYDYATYTHDSEGRILTEHLVYDDVEYGSGMTRDITYTYDSNKNLIKKAFDNVSTNYTYDSNGNLIGEATVNSVGTATETAYTYDGNGNLICKTNTSGSDVYTDTYAYDKSGNLVSHIETSPYWTNQYTYTYDRNGNRLSEQQYDGTNALNTYYHYDGNNRLVKKEAEFGVYRNGVYSVNTRTYTYTYTNEGLLRTTTETVDSSIRTMTYNYDAFGNMTSYVDSSSYLRHDTTVTYSYQLFYYPNGVPEHIQEILVKQPPL